MKTMIDRTFGQAAIMLLMLAPAAACAKPVGQDATAKREGTNSRAGVTLADFVRRHESRLLAGDTDGDGKVSKAEFIAATKAGKGDPARRFARVDRNSDGMLDKAEIDAMLTRRFERLDANRDGVASADERVAARTTKGTATGDEPES